MRRKLKDAQGMIIGSPYGLLREFHQLPGKHSSFNLAQSLKKDYKSL